MKSHITDSLKMLDEQNIIDKQIRWEFLKYEMRKFSKKFPKTISLETKAERITLEEKVKFFKYDVQNFNSNQDYLSCI